MLQPAHRGRVEFEPCWHRGDRGARNVDARLVRTQPMRDRRVAEAVRVAVRGRGGGSRGSRGSRLIGLVATAADGRARRALGTATGARAIHGAIRPRGRIASQIGRETDVLPRDRAPPHGRSRRAERCPEPNGSEESACGKGRAKNCHTMILGTNKRQCVPEGSNRRRSQCQRSVKTHAEREARSRLRPTTAPPRSPRALPNSPPAAHRGAFWSTLQCANPRSALRATCPRAGRPPTRQPCAAPAQCW